MFTSRGPLEGWGGLFYLSTLVFGLGCLPSLKAHLEVEMKQLLPQQATR